MNYQLRLVCGDDALFFLEEWPPKGVEINERVVGLFDAAQPRWSQKLQEALALYDLKLVSFELVDLLKIGLSPAWTWKAMRWFGRCTCQMVEPARRLEELLGPGLHEDRDRQVRVLKLVQAMVKRLGPPALIEGSVTRPSGREERVVVYATGVVAYDRTPHPLPFLQAVAEVIL